MMDEREIGALIQEIKELRHDLRNLKMIVWKSNENALEVKIRVKLYINYNHIITY